MKGLAQVAVGLITVFIATFTLFYIFHSLEIVYEHCREQPTTLKICKDLSPFSFTMIIIILIIGGFGIMICGTAYILLSLS